MGPTCILDKSSIRCFTYAEAMLLSRYYSANLPHILLLEILADIKKQTKRGAKMLRVNRHGEYAMHHGGGG